MAGGPLTKSIAENQYIDGSDKGSFYLASSPAAAEYFALRRQPGAILQYGISNSALSQLLSSGATIGTIPAGGANLPGNQLVIRPSAYPTFNAARSSGQITVRPYSSGD